MNPYPFMGVHHIRTAFPPIAAACPGRMNPDMDDKDKDKETTAQPDAKPVEDSMFRRFQNIWDEIADRRERDEDA